MGDAKKDDLRVGFDSRLKLKFCGSKVTSKVTSDAGLLAYRDRDEALGLTEIDADLLADSRLGTNKQHLLVPLLRQSIYNRLAGYEDVADEGVVRAEGDLVVPEPASIAIWGILGLCLAGYGYLRRRRNS